MKCQKCGNNDVIFHHSSNVNGCVTETHLCSKCATESGYDIEKLFEIGSIFEKGVLVEQEQLADLVFPMRGIGGFVPIAIPMIQANKMMPFTMRSMNGMIEQGTPCDCGCGGVIKNEPKVEVDEEMKMRRELNAQMQAAVVSEEFEKAAELRDKIRALEAGRKDTCDSETTIQDSPTAQ